MTHTAHAKRISDQFSPQANAYLTSPVHAAGEELQRLQQWLAPFDNGHILDIGCGAGHASFTASPLVTQVTAYDLSNEMLRVVKETADNRQMTNIDCQQGVSRMKTPAPTVAAIRGLQQAVSGQVQSYFQLQEDGSFSTDTVMFCAQRRR
ncbi:Methyltransferase domain-containing protein [Rosenbergiella nectarea]|uniref:Methyltransferase domain-containing protein n=1 Tax=Rosenbergiella nectarea TaxID=988801 RepID=A0A1H9EVK6_9GAMM|nr:class I SAM-dependent methyltransferase [Rosenbergiella nectarea]SEQ29672.1 Methyltransferase domain-containing protein [Rosenbergiella nectarea]